jgi:hypothetical protein
MIKTKTKTSKRILKHSFILSRLKIRIFIKKKINKSFIKSVYYLINLKNKEKEKEKEDDNKRNCNFF